METDTGIRLFLSTRRVIGCAGHKVGRPNCGTEQKEMVYINSMFSFMIRTTFSNSRAHDDVIFIVEASQ